MNRAVARRQLTGSALVFAAVALASCGPKAPAPPTPPPAVRVPVAPVVGPALSAASYVSLASSSALFSVRAAELAQQRAQDGRVRSLAQTIAREQGGVGSQLNFAGRRLDLLPSATLLPQHQARLDALAASNDFDRSWLRSQESVLAECAATHGDFARRGPSPTLRPVAEMAAPVCQRHLKQVRQLESGR